MLLFDRLKTPSQENCCAADRRSVLLGTPTRISTIVKREYAVLPFKRRSNGFLVVLAGAHSEDVFGEDEQIGEPPLRNGFEKMITNLRFGYLLIGVDVGDRTLLPTFVFGAYDGRFGDRLVQQELVSSLTDEIHSPPLLIISSMRSTTSR